MSNVDISMLITKKKKAQKTKNNVKAANISFKESRTCGEQ